MKIRIILLFILANIILFAQERMLTLDNTVFPARDGFIPQHLAQLNWILNTNEYYYIERQGAQETLIRSNPNEKGTGKKIINNLELNTKLSELHLSPVGSVMIFPIIKWTTTSAFQFEYGETICTYNTGSKKLTSVKKKALPEGAENQDEAEGTGYIAYTQKNNLWIHAPQIDGTFETPVSTETNENILYGHSVHREEFGIYKGTFWSPSGNLLAFYRMDQTMVTDYPILDLSVQPAKTKMIKYPMAGGTSHQVTVGIYNVGTKKIVYLATGEPKEQYLTNIAWSPDNKYVYIAVLNRDQNHLWLNRYNAETGALEKTLFEETDPKYVHPVHTMIFVSGHPDEFIWQRQLVSAENPLGLNAMYLYNTEGKLLRQVSGTATDCKDCLPVEVTDVYGFDLKGNTIYFQGAPAHSCEKQIYAADLTLGNKWSAPKVTGTHSAQFSTDKKYYIDTYSAIDVPCIQSIYDGTNAQAKLLLTAANPLIQIDPRVKLDMNYFKGSNRFKLFTIKAADGETDLWCRMILPSNFDSTKKYPTMTYLYNGPNVQLVTNSWMGGMDFFCYYMSQQGYVVFTVDGRGSGNRGMKFEQATFRHLGTEEIADQEKGLQFLKSKSYVDQKRNAVFGWSYGGFMTTSLMVKKPDLFKCGVAGGPVIDWSYYEVMYTERYMDTPQTNPEGYKESNLLNYAGNLKGKLLQIHGTIDDVVVWQHSLLFQKATVDAKTQCDYYVYPGHEHNVRGKDRVHLYTKVSQYIIANT
ncbi:S9 family peptidase [soil metagenome]